MNRNATAANGGVPATGFSDQQGQYHPPHTENPLAHWGIIASVISAKNRRELRKVSRMTRAALAAAGRALLQPRQAHRVTRRGGPAKRPSVRRRAARGGASRSSPDDGPGEEPPQDGGGPGGPPPGPPIDPDPGAPAGDAPFIITATTKTGEPYIRRPIDLDDFDDFDDFDVWPDDGDHLS